MTIAGRTTQAFRRTRVLQGLREVHQGLRQELLRAGHRDKPRNGACPDGAGPYGVQWLRPLCRCLP